MNILVPTIAQFFLKCSCRQCTQKSVLTNYFKTRIFEIFVGDDVMFTTVTTIAPTQGDGGAA